MGREKGCGYRSLRVLKGKLRMWVFFLGGAESQGGYEKDGKEQSCIFTKAFQAAVEDRMKMISARLGEAMVTTNLARESAGGEGHLPEPCKVWEAAACCVPGKTQAQELRDGPLTQS